MSSPRTSSFLKNLRESKLLDEAQLQEIEGWPSAAAGDDRVLAQELVDRDLLTRFQAEQVLAGRTQGFSIGPYTVLDRIGAGGMGQVYKAMHRQMQRTVALKVLPPSRRSDPEVQARFMREVRAAAQLNHPNIVKAYDVGEERNITYLVMEYVEGTDLYHLVKDRGPLKPRLAARVAHQAALALEHARKRGIVHRDIKPANILIDHQGTAKVLDMGLARFESQDDDPHESTALTRDGTVMGTLDYLAPEQAMDTHSADTRADIYSLGCTLYHMLTGRVPFPGGTATQKLLKHQMHEPAALTELAPHVPADMAAVVAKMMAKRVEDRYQTPGEVADALTPWAAPSTRQTPSGVVPGAPVATPHEPSGGLPSVSQATRPGVPLGELQEAVACEGKSPSHAGPARPGVPAWIWGIVGSVAAVPIVVIALWAGGVFSSARSPHTGPDLARRPHAEPMRPETPPVQAPDARPTTPTGTASVAPHPGPTHEPTEPVAPTPADDQSTQAEPEPTEAEANRLQEERRRQDPERRRKLAEVNLRHVANADTVQQAMGRLTQELKVLSAKQKLLVIWLFDESITLRDEQRAIRQSIDDVYREISKGRKEPSGKERDREEREREEPPKRSRGRRGRRTRKRLRRTRRTAPSEHTVEANLLMAVGSYGRRVHWETSSPCAEVRKIASAIDKVPVDTTGKENVCRAVWEAARKWYRYHTTYKRQLVICVVTDEGGDDDHLLETAVDRARKYDATIYVFGRQATFGSPWGYEPWADPKTGLKFSVRVRRGPESAGVECLGTDGIRGPWAPLPSGFGPWGLMRMARETKGIYFILPAPGERRYDLQDLCEYLPEPASLRDYLSRRAGSRFRSGIHRVIKDSEAIVTVRAFPGARNEYLKLFPGARSRAMQNLKSLVDCERRLRGLARDRDVETARRWQAAYDLMLAQIVTYQVVHREYVAYLCQVERNAPKEDTRKWPQWKSASLRKHMRWHVSRAPNLREPTNAPKRAEAVRLLEQVIRRHPNTPWAVRAADEKNSGMSVRFGEFFADPRRSAVRVPTP